MSKIIVHPGNGVDFPRMGDYVKLNLVVYDSDRNLLFESKELSEEKFLEIRFRTPEGNFLTDLEELIGAMSLYEKCLLTIDKTNEKIMLESEVIKDMVKNNKEIIFEVEIVDINKNSHS
jgi:hypothetical protein